MLDDLDDLIVDAPKGKEVAADFTVSGAEAAFFGFGDGKSESFGEFIYFRALFRGVRVDDDAADIVEQAGEEGAISGLVGEALGARDAAGQQGGAQTVVPHLCGRSFFAGMIAVAGEGLQAENEAADSFDADQLHRFRDADDFVANAEMCGIDDLQKLGGDDDVLFDDFSDVLDRSPRRLERLFNLKKGLGRARQRADAADDAANFGIGDQIAERRQADEEIGDRFILARLIEVTVADEKAARDLNAIRVAGENQAGAVGLMFDNVSEELEAVHLRHRQIGDDDIKFARMKELNGIFSAVGGEDFVMAFEEVREMGIHFAHRHVIVDEQDRAQRHL